jgi:hypothetical protein
MVVAVCVLFLPWQGNGKLAAALRGEVLRKGWVLRLYGGGSFMTM